MKSTQQLNRYCCVCTSKLIGRKDKVYCDNRCKYLHHKAAKIQIEEKFTYNSRRELRNLIILEGMFGEYRKEVIIHKNLLFKYGFDLLCFFKNQKNKNSYKIKHLPNNLVLIIKTEKLKDFAFSIFIERWRRIFPPNFEHKNGALIDGVHSFFKEKSVFTKPILTVIPLI
ncbi:MAG: hypothetical protein ACPGU5_09030 [Lishizhenia sp.]